jgi:hypothetical protein
MVSLRVQGVCIHVVQKKLNPDVAVSQILVAHSPAPSALFFFSLAVNLSTLSAGLGSIGLGLTLAALSLSSLAFSFSAMMLPAAIKPNDISHSISLVIHCLDALATHFYKSYALVSSVPVPHRCYFVLV